MDTTLLIYFALLVVFAGAAIYLIMRDMNAADEAKRTEEPEQVKLTTLPFAGDPKKPDGMSDAIDQRFNDLIHQSGIEIAPEAAFLSMVLSGLVIGGAVLMWRDDLAVAVVGFVFGMTLPYFYFVSRRNQRIKDIREQLPNSMEAMARAVRAGETLDQAVELTASGTPEPLGIEWRRTARHLEMGLSVPGAMKSMVKRAPLMELRILSTALNVQRRTGGNLSQTLERLSHVIRDRLSYQRQFQAATGSSRMATILIAAAGPLVFTYMIIFQPDYMGQFFNLAGGWTLLGIAIVLQVIGLIWVTALLRNRY
jgi:tight adherence protein B